MLPHGKKYDCDKNVDFEVYTVSEDKGRNVNEDLKTLLWVVTVNTRLPQVSKYIADNWDICYKPRKVSACVVVLSNTEKNTKSQSHLYQ